MTHHNLPTPKWLLRDLRELEIDLIYLMDRAATAGEPGIAETLSRMLGILYEEE